MLSAALTIYQFSSINVDWQISGVELAEHRGAISFFFRFSVKQNYFSILFFHKINGRHSVTCATTICPLCKR